MQVISRLLICSFQHLEKVYYSAFKDVEHYFVASIAIFLLIIVLGPNYFFKVIL